MKMRETGRNRKNGKKQKNRKSVSQYVRKVYHGVRKC